MISPRWRIVLRSLSRDRVRTLLAVLAMAVSVMSIGMVSGASVILVGTLDSAYRHNHPADAVLETSLIDNGVLSAVRQVPGVSAKDQRGQREYGRSAAETTAATST